MTVLDLMTKPSISSQSWDYFRNVQTEGHQVLPAHARRRPAGHLFEQGNYEVPAGDAEYYYDQTRFKTYLDQNQHQVSDGA